MELKFDTAQLNGGEGILLIEPYGIEIAFEASVIDDAIELLIEPYGIEMRKILILKIYQKKLLIEP